MMLEMAIMAALAASGLQLESPGPMLNLPGNLGLVWTSWMFDPIPCPGAVLDVSGTLSAKQRLSARQRLNPACRLQLPTKLLSGDRGTALSTPLHPCS